MAVYALYHQKGGTGKSTLAVALSWRLAQSGASVLLLDADDQGTASHWYESVGEALNLPLLVRHQLLQTLPEALPRFTPQFEHVIIDAPPRLETALVDLLAICDRLIIPCRPTLPDIWSLEGLSALLAQAQAKRAAPLPAMIAINHYRGEDLGPLHAQAVAYHLSVMDAPIPWDPAFAALFSGAPLPEHFSQLLENLLPR
ncbi:ParA family protein [Magnetofaba australis]|uniref:Putative chromosome segregation ATPase n=1 Tax=Magnetofaba australis IT-1 TaxID=1434232 RepID=A0A1Y2K737_9PROT|nr:ParA family protein [Magnetofaba australis]OSM05350.1 putative chromosome segregation ATPase [Magnetofaba australis IT-1]